MNLVQTAPGELTVQYKRRALNANVIDPFCFVHYFVTLKGKFGVEDDGVSPIGLWFNTRLIKVIP